MSNDQPTVIINPQDIISKIKEIEKRSAEWEEALANRWDTMENDMQVCTGIMVQEFSRLGKPIPAYIKHGEELLCAAWVRDVEAYCLDRYGKEEGSKIAGRVMERLAEISRRMTPDLS